MENKKFHLNITNNETGETLVELDTDVIIGAADEGEGTHEFSFVEGRVLDILTTIMGVKNTLKALYSNHPELKAAEVLSNIFAEKEGKETTENTEN